MSKTHPQQAVPREKTVRFQENFFRVNEVSYINGSLQNPGTLVQLPVGVKAGANLTEVDQNGDEIDQAEEAAAPGNVTLARNAAEIIASVGDLTDEALAQALIDEPNDKDRTTVIAALEAETAKRKA